MGDLQDPDPDEREDAADDLESWGPMARDAVPALIRALHDPAADVRKAAAHGLKRIDPEAAAKAGLK